MEPNAARSLRHTSWVAREPETGAHPARRLAGSPIRLGGNDRGTGADDDVRPEHDHVHGERPLLDAERLDCFRAAVEFQALSAELLPKGCGSLRDQLDRASVSIALNLSEGAGCRSPRQKARYYAIARGSASECGAILAIAGARRLGQPAARVRCQHLVVRIVQMLTKLERRMR
ncbi:MAG: four helix bundle protein [Vicinamibacteria bacterium]